LYKKKENIHAGNQLFAMLYDASTYLINVKDKGKINKFTSASQTCPGCISWIMQMMLENIITPPPPKKGLPLY
jgi:hypothetical protein